MREQNFSGYGTRGPAQAGRPQSAGQHVRPARRHVDSMAAPARRFSFSAPADAPRRQAPVTQDLPRRETRMPAPQVHNPSIAAQNFRAPKKYKQTPAQDQRSSFKLNLPDFSWIKQQTRGQMVMMSAAIFIFLFGLSASIMGFRANLHVQAEAKKLTATNANSEDAGDTPDETEPESNAVANYRVDPSLPRRISIPKIGVDARIRPLGTKSNNELKAPANIYDAGWYERSARLGEKTGATLIDGHVHGLTKPGVFYGLKKIGIGELIEVERGDGEVFRYKVVRTQTYNRHNVDMAAAIASVDPARPGLNLITCTGSLEKGVNTYSDRLLVQAVLVD